MNSKRQLKMMSSIVRRSFQLCLVMVLSGLFAGCAPGIPRVAEVPTDIMTDYLADKPAPLKGMYAKVLQEGKRNYVLNQLQAGVAAMELGEFKLAEKSFDEALLRIEAVYANNAEAAKARSLWYEEGAKDFKGEPYERAMAYYYRGILYLRDADYENARACFKAGMLQDAFIEEEQFQFDFALLAFLEGWASQQLKDHALAAEAYAEVKKLRPDFVLPAADDNVLILAETGKSPRKVADGVGHAELKYRRGKNFDEERAWVGIPGQAEQLVYPMEDVFYQARTRGGRPVDKILEGKAVFLKSGLGVGTALTEMSSTFILTNAAFTNSSSGMEIGAAIGAVGGVVTLVAMNAKPHADTRYWKNLPDIVHVATCRNSDLNKVEFRFGKKDLSPTELPVQSVELQQDKNGGGVVWARSRRALLN